MENLGFSLTNYMKEANAAMEAGDRNAAYEALVHAAECTLQMAKQSSGAARDKYIANFKSIKLLIDQLEKKITPPEQARTADTETPPPPPVPSAPVVMPSAPPTPPRDSMDPPPVSPEVLERLKAKKAQAVAPAAPPPVPTPPIPADNKPPVPPAPDPILPPLPPIPGSPNDGEGPNTKNGGNSHSAYGPRDTLTPRTLSDYIGQPDAVTAVRDLIVAARIKNTVLPHLIIYGSNGLGKTTFAKIIAAEMQAGFVELNVTKTTPKEMIAILKGLRPKDILFIDEIHTVPLVVAESLLYSAMQDGRITYTEGKGKYARTVTFDLAPFTLIGATTEIGKLAKPFTHRAITIRLKEYTDEVLGGIIKSSVNKIGMDVSDELALAISKRCRNNPRTANNIVKRITDKALVSHVSAHNLINQGPFETPEAIRRLHIELTPSLVSEFFAESGIDAYGLENGDRELLRIIIERYGGGPVGVDNLARAMNESNNVISQKYEAYLIKKGLIRVDRDGRVAMPDAYRLLGLPVPDEIRARANEDLPSDSGDDSKAPPPPPGGSYVPPTLPPSPPIVPSSPEPEKPQNSGDSTPIRTTWGVPSDRYDHVSVTAMDSPDPTRCRVIEALITYPPTARVIGESLDDLFPAVEKPEVEYGKTTFELDIVFPTHTRYIECDSKLESKFATVLASTGYAIDLRAQTLEIPYISQELANRRYFPDFIIKDYRGRIAVIEMKNYDMMSYHLNIDKYEQLARFCTANGYGYAEIMKPYDSDSYVSVEMLHNAPVDRELESHILATIQQHGMAGDEAMFTEEDFELYRKAHPATKRSDVYTVLLNNRDLKNVDRVGKSFKIIESDYPLHS